MADTFIDATLVIESERIKGNIRKELQKIRHKADDIRDAQVKSSVLSDKAWRDNQGFEIEFD